jgi:hypothetical protein
MHTKSKYNLKYCIQFHVAKVKYKNTWGSLLELKHLPSCGENYIHIALEGASS